MAQKKREKVLLSHFIEKFNLCFLSALMYMSTEVAVSALLLAGSNINPEAAWKTQGVNEFKKEQTSFLSNN